MQKSNLIYKLKGIAIICVVCAHCGNRVSHSQLDLYLDVIRNNIAGIGVPLFLVISGYLYNNIKPFLEFWKNKCKTTIIPWIFWGTVVWGYEVVRKGLGYAKLYEWLLGVDTYLWFMRTIVLIWLLLYWVKTKCSKMFVFTVFTLIRIIIFNVMDYSISNNVLKQLLINLPYFTFGMLVKEIRLIENNIIAKCLPFYDIIKKPSTFGGNNIYRYLSDEILFLGKYSFIIYLIHMPVAGAVSNVFSRSSILLYFVLAQPIIVLMVVKKVINILKKVCKALPCISCMIGIKE